MTQAIFAGRIDFTSRSIHDDSRVTSTRDVESRARKWTVREIDVLCATEIDFFEADARLRATERRDRPAAMAAFFSSSLDLLYSNFSYQSVLGCLILLFLRFSLKFCC